MRLSLRSAVYSHVVRGVDESAGIDAYRARPALDQGARKRRIAPRCKGRKRPELYASASHVLARGRLLYRSLDKLVCVDAYAENVARIILGIVCEYLDRRTLARYVSDAVDGKARVHSKAVYPEARVRDNGIRSVDRGVICAHKSRDVLRPVPLLECPA